MIFSAYKNRGIFYGCHPQKILLYIIEGLHIPTIGRNKTERNWYNAKIISKAKQICFHGQRISYVKGFIVESQRTPCLYAVPAAWLEIFYRRTCLHQQGERNVHRSDHRPKSGRWLQRKHIPCFRVSVGNDFFMLSWNSTAVVVGKTHAPFQDVCWEWLLCRRDLRLHSKSRFSLLIPSWNAMLGG